MVFILQNLVRSMSTEKARKWEIRTRRAVFQLFFFSCFFLKYTHYKNQSKTPLPFYWDILTLMCPPAKEGSSSLGGRRSLCFLLQSRNLSAGPCQKNMLQITLCGKQGLQRGFVHLSPPALPCFSVPPAKWKINHSLLAVLVIIGWICHRLAHPCSEPGKA